MRYTRKVSGPFLDRIDLHVSVPPVPWNEIEGGRDPEPSRVIHERVRAARARAARRSLLPGFRNADLSAALFDRLLDLDTSAKRLLPAVVERLGLSLRALHRALRVARTIADLAESERVMAAHFAEAVSYRTRPPGSNALTEPRRLHKMGITFGFGPKSFSKKLRRTARSAPWRGGRRRR